MEKNVVLSLEEYERLVKIAAIASQLMDKYAESFEGEKYVTKSEEYLPEYKDLLRYLLYMDDDVKNDVTDSLPENYYKEHPDSVFFEPWMEF
jgi:hypothetical protein